jgi:transcriptional regulator with XRE-family HTH domain
MEVADLIKKILDARNLSHKDLADLCDIDRTQITRYLSGERTPGEFACLILSGLAEGSDRAEWVRLSEVSKDQLHLLSRALGTPEPKVLSAEDKALYDWFHNPEGPMEDSIRDLVKQLLVIRKPKKAK